MTKVLVLGRGILGTALARTLSARGVAHEVLPHAACDVRDAAAVRRALQAASPDVVVNAAAYTKVDACEEERETAFLVNAMAPGLLAREARRRGLRFVHVSTDFVFSGVGRAQGPPFTEEDAPSPTSVYGQSKLFGELEIAREGGEWLCVRTSWHYGDGGPNFVRTIRERALAGGPLSVVADQRGRPTYSGHLAEALCELVRLGARGLYHYADTVEGGAMTWHAFAEAIVARCGASIPVAAIASADMPRPARRPAYSALDTSKYERLVGHPPAPWRAGLEAYLAALAGAAAPTHEPHIA